MNAFTINPGRAGSGMHGDSGQAYDLTIRGVATLTLALPEVAVEAPLREDVYAE